MLAACTGGGSAAKSADDRGERAEPPSGRSSSAAGRSKRSKQESGKALKGKIIVLDPGHNGGNADHPEIIGRQIDVVTGRKECDTTGTESATGYPEHAFTWDVSNRLAGLLRASGAKVILTRKNDTGVGPCINERAAIANRAGADAALSVHADGAPVGGRGFHIIEPVSLRGYTDKIVAPSREFGKELRDAYRAGTGMPYSSYRGRQAIDPRDDLGGLNLSTVPKVFIECGNMRNPAEAVKLGNPAFRQRIAESLADGFADYFD